MNFLAFKNSIVNSSFFQNFPWNNRRVMDVDSETSFIKTIAKITLDRLLKDEELLPEMFNNIENGLIEGDSQTKDIIRLVLTELVQITGWEGIHPSNFDPYMGTETKKIWLGIDLSNRT